MNAATFNPPVTFENPPHEFVLSIDEAPVPLLLSRRDRVTAGFRRAAEDKKAAIDQNPELSEEQRRHALEMLRQQTEAQMRCALGERNFHAFKAFNQWWFRELATANRGLS
jgi:hypothetical protein